MCCLCCPGITWDRGGSGGLLTPIFLSPYPKSHPSPLPLIFDPAKMPPVLFGVLGRVAGGLFHHHLTQHHPGLFLELFLGLSLGQD